MTKPAPRTVTNKKLKDKEWYVSIAANLLDLKFATLAKDLGKALNPEVKDTAKELVALYLRAFNSALASAQLELEVSFDKQDLKDKQQLFLDNILDPNFPSYHPFFQQMIKQVELEGINQQKLQISSAWNELSRAIRKNFAGAFSNIVQAGDEKFVNALNYIEQLKSAVEPIESQLIGHMNSVLVNVEHESLAIDADLVLRKSYVTPNCGVHFEDVHRSEKQGDADNIIAALTEKISKSEHPIIIHGQPGHGKTSTAKMLVNVLAQTSYEQQQPMAVLFYEFKNLRGLDAPVCKVLNSATPFLQDEGFFENKHTALILDGLDERQLADGSDEVLKGFVSALFTLVGSQNKKDNTKVNLILTGRSQFVGQIKQSFNSAHWIFEIADFNQEQIDLWLQRFNQQKPDAQNITSEQLNKYHLQDLMSQPILLAISSIMLCDDDGKKLIGELDTRNISRADIYRTIIEWSHKKRWQNNPTEVTSESLTYDEYFLLLQAIAFEMFKTGEESIKLSVLAKALQDTIFDLDFLENKSPETIEKLCSQLRVSFFFKGVEDKAFSFLHKSIKDFLIVTGITDVFLCLLSRCHIRDLDEKATKLYKIFGENMLSDEDHIPMFEEWICYKDKELKPHHELLMAFWQRICQQDMPIQLPLSKAISSQNNIMHNYYQLISRYFALCSTDENQQLFGGEKVQLFGISKNQRWQMISFQEFYQQNKTDGIRKFSFRNQVMGEVEQLITGVLVNCDFSHCHFYSNRIIDLKIISCDFSNAVFKGCWVARIHFHNCDMTRSVFTRLGKILTTSKFVIKHAHYNSFEDCNLTQAKLSISIGDCPEDWIINDPYGKKRFLFWNCNFDQAEFDCEALSTVDYDDDFDGVRLNLPEKDQS